MRVKHISSFVFNNASYQITDNQGSELILSIDYKNNDFLVKQVSQIVKKSVLIEVKSIAMDLLSRKHKVNFAEKA